MSESSSDETYTAFAAERRIATGGKVEVALAMKSAAEAGADHLLAFDDKTGRQVDFDLRGSVSETNGRLGEPVAQPAPASRGRPKLGVVPREVTLLPRHWEWLALQPGGASAALRRLVEQARKADAGAFDVRQAQEAAYRVMSALAGDLVGFEEAARALFAGDTERAAILTSAWPADIADYVNARINIVARLVPT